MAMQYAYLTRSLLETYNTCISPFYSARSLRMNVITLSATNFPIKSVKIFSSRADVVEVTRVFPLHFTQSLNESQAIEISNLSLPCSPHSGIRASVTIGSDDLLVMDYYHDSSDYKSNLFGHQRETNPVSSDVLRNLQAEYMRLEDERQLRQQSFAFLSTYMNSLAQGDALAGGAEPAQLVKFFDEFVDIGKSRSEVIAVLDQQIKDVQKDIDKETWRLFLDSSSLATKVTVILAPVSGRTATTAELELKYRVSATWKPVYDIHVKTIDSTPSSSVVLTYLCQISQSTGENWDNVELAVITAEPHVPSVGLPEPKKMEIRQQGLLWQPDSYHQPAVRPIGPRVTPFWNTPGHASPFGNILSTQQAGKVYLEALRVFLTKQTPVKTRPGPHRDLQQSTCSELSRNNLPPQLTVYLDLVEIFCPQHSNPDPSQDSTGAAQGPAAENVFGAFQGQPTTTTTGLFGTATTLGLFASAPAQSSTPAGRTSGFSHFPTQSQAFSSTIAPSSPHPSTAGNSSVSSFGGSTAAENTLGFNKPTLNLQQSQPLTFLSASAQPSLSQHQRERAVLGELNKAITHIATSKVFIPSRAKGGTHHVLIATIPLKATFARVAVSSVDNRVFWTCDISNTSNYVLTPGTAHTYLDGRHISDSHITSVDQPQTIQCSLGVDPAVTTQFNRTVDSLPDFTVLNGKAITTHTITTAIKNTYHHAVSNVIVRTSLPLPADPRVTVALQEPEGLADIDSGTVRVGDGCYAGWSTTGDRARKNDGLFEWVL
ncbi:hypothetical protein BDR03DRAFT_1015846 [Suillus americanus]|nr:hypothetical protein BDR03DRAFT_1015846 [Suillus americanus]